MKFANVETIASAFSEMSLNDQCPAISVRSFAEILSG